MRTSGHGGTGLDSLEVRAPGRFPAARRGGTGHQFRRRPDASSGSAMRRLLHDIDALYTCDDAHTALANAYVVVDGERVAEVGAGVPPQGDFDERIDLSGTVAMPGLVNTHHHFFQTLTRAIPAAQRGHVVDWLSAMYPVWGRMTPDDLAAAARATAAELLLTGATTSVDHAYLVPRADNAYVDAEVAAVRAAGLRLHLVRGSVTALEADLSNELTAIAGPRAGGVLDEPGAVLQAMRDTLDRHHETGWGARVSVALGPTTTTYEDLPFMEAVASLAAEAGCGLHTHFHPRPDERETCSELFGRTPAEVLQKVGWLTGRTWFAHSTRLSAADMALLAAAGCAIAHCPRMVLRLGARVTPVHEMRAAGLRVTVGVDGGASNDSGSMLGEMRLALLLHRVAGGEGAVPVDTWLDPYDVLWMATRDAAAVLGRDDIGQVATGKCADIAAFDVTGVGFAGARTDLLSGLMLAGDDTRAALTMVAGEPIVRGGHLVAGDERALRRAVDAATSRLIGEASELTGTDYAAFAPMPHRPAAPSIRGAR